MRKNLSLLVVLFALSAQLAKADTYYPRKIVMEEATGTWCGWCVRGIETIERMSKQYPDNFIAIGLHSGDEMSNPVNYEPITGMFRAYPNCLFNRSVNGPVSVSLYAAQSTIEELKDQGIAMIEATAAFADASRNQVKVSTNTTFGFTSSSADYKIAYVVLEDNVGPYRQSNYYSGNSDYDDPNHYMYEWVLIDSYPLITFNDVARGIFGSADGVTGSVPSSVTEGQACSYEYTFELPDNISNKDNLRIVTLLIDSNTGEIVNADQVALEGGSGEGGGKGDINEDGKVNGTDIQAVINVIVDEDYVEAADINKDGKVNGTDIQEIINIIVEEE
jgi:thiol-disulfide isomerase/thioredoxin